MPTYPTLDGAQVHWPYSRDRMYKNIHNEMEHGYRYSYNLRATPIMRFTIEYQSLSDSALVTLRTFWNTVQGSYDPFDFTDPDTAVNFPVCRFDQPELEVRHLGPNQNAVTVHIREVIQ